MLRLDDPEQPAPPAGKALNPGTPPGAPIFTTSPSSGDTVPTRAPAPGVQPVPQNDQIAYAGGSSSFDERTGASAGPARGGPAGDGMMHTMTMGAAPTDDGDFRRTGSGAPTQRTPVVPDAPAAPVPQPTPTTTPTSPEEFFSRPTPFAHLSADGNVVSDQLRYMGTLFNSARDRYNAEHSAAPIVPDTHAPIVEHPWNPGHGPTTFPDTPTTPHFDPGQTAIDPEHDLRGRQILARDDGRTRRFAGMTDRAARGLPTDTARDAQRYGEREFRGYGNTNVRTGRDVGAGPGEGRDLRRLNGQANRANDQVSRFDRGRDAAGERDQYSRYLGDTDVEGGPDIGAGPSEGRTLRQLNQDAAGATHEVAQYDRDRQALRRRDQFSDFVGDTDVRGGGRVDFGRSVQPDLDQNDAMSRRLVGRAANADRGNLSRSARREFGNYLRPDELRGGRAIAAENSGRVDRYGNLTDRSAHDLADVDRFELAKQKLDEWNKSTQGDYDLDLQHATAAAAAQGQGRSGMLRTEYGDIASRRMSQRDAMEHQLLNEALEGSIGDQFNKTNTLRNIESGVADQEGALRSEARGEREYGTGIRRENLAAQQRAREEALGMGESAADATMNQDRAGAGLAMERGSQLAGREAQRRAGLQSERGYRTSVEEGNVNRRIATREAAAEYGSSDADRGMAARTGAADLLGRAQGAMAGRQAGRRTELRGERGYRTDIEEGNVNRRLATRAAAEEFGGNQADRNFATRTGAADVLGRERGAMAGREAGRRGEMRDDRNFRTGVNERNVDRRISARQAAGAAGREMSGMRAENAYRRLNASSGLEETARGNTRLRAEDLRGERGYQGDMERQAYERRLAEHQLGKDDRAFDQRQALDLLGAGESGNPADTLAYLSRAGIDPSVLSELARSMSAGGGRPSGGGTTINVNPGAVPTGTPTYPGQHEGY